MAVTEHGHGYRHGTHNDVEEDGLVADEWGDVAPSQGGHHGQPIEAVHVEAQQAPKGDLPQEEPPEGRAASEPNVQGKQDAGGESQHQGDAARVPAGPRRGQRFGGGPEEEDAVVQRQENGRRPPQQEEQSKVFSPGEGEPHHSRGRHNGRQRD